LGPVTSLYIYQTTHNTQDRQIDRQTYIHAPGGLESAIPANKGELMHALDHTVTVSFDYY